MNSASIAARARAPSTLRAQTASVRNWLISTRCAILACAAVWLAYALRVGAAAGPFHLFEVVFFTGAVILATGIAWSYSFFGAVVFASAAVAAGTFLDTTPDNVLLAAPAFVVACLLLHRWKVERTADAG